MDINSSIMFNYVAVLIYLSKTNLTKRDPCTTTQTLVPLFKLDSQFIRNNTHGRVHSDMQVWPLTTLRDAAAYKYAITEQTRSNASRHTYASLDSLHNDGRNPFPFFAFPLGVTPRVTLPRTRF